MRHLEDIKSLLSHCFLLPSAMRVNPLTYCARTTRYSKCERMWKRTAVTYFKVQWRILTGGDCRQLKKLGIVCIDRTGTVYLPSYACQYEKTSEKRCDGRLSWHIWRGPEEDCTTSFMVASNTQSRAFYCLSYLPQAAGAGGGSRPSVPPGAGDHTHSHGGSADGSRPGRPWLRIDQVSAVASNPRRALQDSDITQTGWWRSIYLFIQLRQSWTNVVIHEDGCLLGLCDVLSAGRPQTFRKCLHCRSRFAYRPEDGGSKHLWNEGKLLPYCMVQQPRRQPSSYSLL
jgi:hypothetical protein